MGSKKKSTTPMAPVHKIGMWSTISDSVQSGWGAVARLLTVVAAFGVVTTVVALVSPTDEIGLFLRTLVDVRF